MKQYLLSDFEKNSAWLVFRLDVKVANDFLDMYLLMHLPSEAILGHQIIEHEITQKHLDDLFKLAASCGKVPDSVLLAKGDPAESFIQTCTEKFSIKLETVPKSSLDTLLVTIRQSFGSCFFSPSAIAYMPTKEDDNCDAEATQQFIPDSYDPCPCASGKKYKFCCKKIFHEMINAMVAAEDGNQIEATQWIEKAKTWFLQHVLAHEMPDKFYSYNSCRTIYVKLWML